MKQYVHLQREERIRIEVLHNEGLGANTISQRINRSKRTIERELKRLGGFAYSASAAMKDAQSKQQHSRRNRQINESDWRVVETHIKAGFSPEQISGRAIHKGYRRIATIHIYRWIQQIRPDLKKHLYFGYKRSGSHKKLAGVSLIPHRTSIHDRPIAVQDREIVGHWEGDTVVGADHDGYIVSLVERKTRFACFVKTDSKHSLLCIGAMYHQLKHFPAELRQTITFDNGLEFAEHTILTEKLPSLTAYFADPYRSCQRGSNEYTNRLLRRFVPKASSIADLSHQQLQQFQDHINNLPRKCLGFLTPAEALAKELQNINQNASLQTVT